MLPVGVTLGTISILGIPFDFATVIIAAIAIGISVDDNIHILHCYNHHKKKGMSHREAVRTSIFLPGIAVSQTTILFGVGFLIFAFSDLVILYRFAVFTTEAMILAWISSLILLPTLLNYWGESSNLQQEKE